MTCLVCIYTPGGGGISPSNWACNTLLGSSSYNYTYIEHVDLNPQARLLAKLAWSLNFDPKDYMNTFIEQVSIARPKCDEDVLCSAGGSVELAGSNHWSINPDGSAANPVELQKHLRADPVAMAHLQQVH